MQLKAGAFVGKLQVTVVQLVVNGVIKVDDQPDLLVAEAIVFENSSSLFIKVFGESVKLLIPGNLVTLYNGRFEQVLGGIRLVIRSPFGKIVANNCDDLPGTNKKEIKPQRVRNRHIRQQSLAKDKTNLSYSEYDYFYR